MFNFSRENTGEIAKWWRNVDKQILFLFTFLLLLGLFFSFSSTTSVMSENMNKLFTSFIKDIIDVFPEYKKRLTKYYKEILSK